MCRNRPDCVHDKRHVDDYKQRVIVQEMLDVLGNKVIAI